jgi:ADP-ribosylglycohydrolase
VALPSDYVERVYAGVLGKIIGVYLGRPFEGWSYENIKKDLGDIWYYVHERFDVPLIVTDDDISGTFTFIRALEDYEYDRNVTPAQIGQTWLNYLIEERTILWWGGLGNSTEHTAYLRLKHGHKAPESGSIGLNGRVVAEQIGAQIFIDGWAMVAPGDPAYAADLARRAGSVSHDGEAIHGAQVIAAMESQAFVESDMNKLIDTGLSVIPNTSIIYRMINEIREWHAAQPDDWEATRAQIAANYGYDKYGGNCHMVPNHGLIIHALLHGDGDFQKSLMIVNTCGWDTDCNSGNVGCLLGIRGGLAAIESGADFRTPVADRMYAATADGGRSITDTVTQTYRMVNTGRRLAGEEPLSPKNGTRFHFELPGAVQGFRSDTSPDAAGAAHLENVKGFSAAGERSLAVHYQGVAKGRVARIGTPTFIPSLELAEFFEKRTYALMSSPTIHSGQIVTASVLGDPDNPEPVMVNLFVRVYADPDDHLETIRSKAVPLSAGERRDFEWQIPDTEGAPINEIGLEITSDTPANGAVYLDYVTWSGTPNVVLTRTPGDVPGRRARNQQLRMWRRAWVNGVDSYLPYWPEPYRLIQNEGRGLLIHGGRDWTDYEASSEITLHMVKAAGIAVRVQGMRRYYALLLCDDGKARLVKALDGDTVLAERDYAWSNGVTKEFTLRAEGNRLQASIDGELLFDVEDTDRPLTGGGAAFVVEEGRIMSEAFAIRP